MGFCGNCGAELENGTKFCGQCGQPVSIEPSDEPKEVPSPPVGPPSKAPEEKPKKSRKRWLIPVIGIPLIVIGIACYWYGKDILRFRNPQLFDKSSLDRYVTTVRFFASGQGLTPVTARVYKKNFSISETRFINWEMKLKHPAPGRRFDFNIDVLWRRSDSSIYAQQRIRAFIESGWNNSIHASGLGNMNPGAWPRGPYTVELYVEGKKIAMGSFMVS